MSSSTSSGSYAPRLFTNDDDDVALDTLFIEMANYYKNAQPWVMLAVTPGEEIYRFDSLGYRAAGATDTDFVYVLTGTPERQHMYDITEDLVRAFLASLILYSALYNEDEAPTSLTEEEWNDVAGIVQVAANLDTFEYPRSSKKLKHAMVKQIHATFAAFILSNGKGLDFTLQLLSATQENIKTTAEFEQRVRNVVASNRPERIPGTPAPSVVVPHYPAPVVAAGAPALPPRVFGQPLLDFEAFGYRFVTEFPDAREDFDIVRDMDYPTTWEYSYELARLYLTRISRVEPLDSQVFVVAAAIESGVSARTTYHRVYGTAYGGILYDAYFKTWDQLSGAYRKKYPKEAATQRWYLLKGLGPKAIMFAPKNAPISVDFSHDFFAVAALADRLARFGKDRRPRDTAPARRHFEELVLYLNRILKSLDLAHLNINRGPQIVFETGTGLQEYRLRSSFKGDAVPLIVAPLPPAPPAPPVLTADQRRIAELDDEIDRKDREIRRYKTALGEAETEKQRVLLEEQERHNERLQEIIIREQEALARIRELDADLQTLRANLAQAHPDLARTEAAHQQTIDKMNAAHAALITAMTTNLQQAERAKDDAVAEAAALTRRLEIVAAELAESDRLRAEAETRALTHTTTGAGATAQVEELQRELEAVQQDKTRSEEQLRQALEQLQEMDELMRTTTRPAASSSSSSSSSAVQFISEPETGGIGQPNVTSVRTFPTLADADYAPAFAHGEFKWNHIIVQTTSVQDFIKNGDSTKVFPAARLLYDSIWMGFFLLVRKQSTGADGKERYIALQHWRPVSPDGYSHKCIILFVGNDKDNHEGNASTILFFKSITNTKPMDDNTVTDASYIEATQFEKKVKRVLRAYSVNVDKESLEFHTAK